MEEKTILSEEQLEQVVEVLGNNRNETDKLLEQIEKEHENDDNSNAPLEEGTGQYIADGVILGDGEIDDLDFDHFENIDNTLDEIINNTIKDNVSKNYDLSDEEALSFANLIIDIKNKKKVTNVYESLPNKLKETVDNLAQDQDISNDKKKLFLDYTARALIEEMINDAELDSITIDLEKAMREMIPTPAEMYSETNREYIEDKFPEVAEKIRETDPKKADNLLDMRQGFIDSYTFEPMYELFKNSKIVKNIRRSEVLWSRVCNEYVSIAGICKFNLYPLNELVLALTTIGFTKLQATRIISLFVYTYTNGITDYKNEEEYNDIYRNAFANYFEANIKNLAISPDLASDFSKNIKNNLTELCNHIDTVISEKEAELSSKKKKKRG